MRGHKRPSSELRICVHLSCPVFCRCWFGKEAGDLVDYIYQGPVMLVLLVGPLWINGLGHKEQSKAPSKIWPGPHSAPILYCACALPTGSHWALPIAACTRLQAFFVIFLRWRPKENGLSGWF